MNVIEILQIADKGTLDKCWEMLRRIDANTFNAQTMDWGAWFASRKTGELFSTKFYNQSITDTGIGEKLNDSAGLSCAPSTDKVKGQDDFASHNAFWCVDCNFIVDDQGVRIPTYIEGQSGFKRTGKVQVGVLTPPLYWGEETVSDGYIKHFSDSEQPKEGLKLTLMPHCKDAFGNPMPYGIVPKYYAGEIDGLMYGSSGLAVKNFMSFNLLHTECQKLGAGYMGAGSERTAYLKNFLWIKYATLNSQKYFTGCTNYSYQYPAAEAAEGVNYITLPKAQANNFYVGGTVSIGEAGESAATSIDRGQAYMRNLADKVLVTKIEAVDDTNSRVYVDAPPFDVTTTTYISSMPLHSGQTDTVLGNDGYLANDSKHSFKIQGVEEGIGSYYVSANECEYKETAEKTIFYNRAGADWSSVQATIQETWKEVGSYESPESADFWIGEETIDLITGSAIPKTVGSGSASGTGDRRYHGGTGTGMREKLERGSVWDGSFAGFSCSPGWGSLSGGNWNYAACVS